MDFIKGELLEVIEWTDDSRDTLSLAVPRRRQGDQERRAADRPRVAGRAVRLPRRVRRHVQARQALADDRQHPGPDEAQVVALRLQLAVQGRRLLRHHAAVHGQQVGHVQPGDAARQRLRHRPRAGVRHLRLQGRRAQDVPARRSPDRITTSASTSSATRCARAS